MGPMVEKIAHRNATRMTSRKISHGKMNEIGIDVNTLL